jgi:heterodisulfide reductase subunit A
MRIGVYICHCGSNIAGTVDCKGVAQWSASLDGVTIARDYEFMCSNLGQEMIKDDIQAHRLDRVVVACCTPRMHEPTFQRAIAETGLNPYFFEQANIREQSSWVHKDREEATQKAKALVAAAVSRVRYHQSLSVNKVPIRPATLVVGAGITGIQAALELANANYPVYLVEREPSIGGRMAQLDETFPTLDCSA